MNAPQPPSTALVVCNPIRPRALGLLPEVEGALASAGLLPVRCPTSPARLDGGVGQILSAASTQAALIVVLGGDGTVRAVAEAVVASGADVPVAVVPAGTANLVARSHGVGDARTALDALRSWAGRRGELARRDLGWVRLQRPDGRWTSEIGFCVSAGFGRSGETILATPESAKRLLGAAGYGVGALGLLSAAGVDVEVSAVPADECVDGRAGSAESFGEVRRIWAVECGLIGGIAPRRAHSGGRAGFGDDRLPRGAHGSRAGLGGSPTWQPSLPGVRIFSSGGPATGALSALAVDLTAEAYPGLGRVATWAQVFAAGLGYPRRRVPELVEAPVQRLALTSAKPVACHIDGEAAGRIIGAELRIDPGALRIVVPQTG